MVRIAIVLLALLLLVANCDAWITSTFIGNKVFVGKGLAATRYGSIMMGMQVKIRVVGRRNGSERWLEDAYSMYETRLRASNLAVETIWHKNDEELIRAFESDLTKGHKIVLLDPRGKMRSSENFSDDLYDWLEVGGSRLIFVVGGAPGLPADLKFHSSQPTLLSLSTMTFTHQFARTILMEQIYRASEIRKGSGYHK